MTPDLVARVEAALGRRVDSARFLGAGTDHTALEVDGHLVARFTAQPSGDAATQVEREANLLQVIAPLLPVAVPQVVAADPREGLLVVTKLPGASLLDRPSPEPQRLVPQLASLLAALGAIPAELTDGIVEPDADDPHDWLADCDRTYAEIANQLDPGHRRDIERFLAEPPPPAVQADALCHNDLGAEHLLADDQHTVTGVIDWSDAARADVAVDLGRLGRDLGPAVAVEIAARLDLDDETIARAAFYARCTLIEDVHHGITTGDRRYSDVALANLARTFHWDAP